MAFNSWLQILRSALAQGRGQRKHGRRGSLRAATHRLSFEILEDRSLLAFIGPVDYSVGPNLQAVVTADFNNDGNLDLAAVNGGGSYVSGPGNTITVRLGDGLGGFGAANSFPTDNGPRSMAVGDFNNDGNLDVVTVNFIVNSIGPNTLSLLMGEGDGAFRPRVDTPFWAPVDIQFWGGQSVAAGDFNADGNTDLVYTFSDTFGGYSGVGVLLADGLGGFAESDFDELNDVDTLVGLAVADLNGDGNQDVVAANYYEATVSVLMGNGDGALHNWYNFATGGHPRAVAVGDFTGDGIFDLVTAGFSTVNVLPGLGDGTFAPPIEHYANTFGMTTVAAADFNGDGNLDVVTSDPAAGTVSVFLGLGDGTLTPPLDHAAGSLSRAAAVGDFNGDGRPDVAAANPGSNTASVLLNDGAWPADLSTPWLRIDDATVMEGNSGIVEATFIVALSAVSTETITVAYASGTGTAAAGSDYESASGTVTFAPGEISKTITVPVIGDRLGEPNETFVVSLSSPTNATISDGQGVGTIADDEPRLSISDFSKAEGKKGKTTLFTFTVTLSAGCDQAVTMSFATANGTAKTSDNDYIAKTGTLTFAPGETTKTITIEVKGDSKNEANETFYLDLFGLSSNGLFTKSRGVGTILNDD